MNEGNGGDCVLRPGKAADPVEGQEPPKDGSIRLELADGTAMIEMTPNGDFLYKGNRVTSDLDAYQVFRAWLDQCYSKGE